MARPLTIFIDARMIRHAGIGTHIRGLIGGMSEVPEIHNIQLGGNPDYLQSYRDSRTEITRDQSIVYSLREQFQSWWNMTKLGKSIDLAHYPNYNTYFNLKWPYVVTIHDLIQFQFNYGNSIKRKLARHLLRRVLKNARQVVCISETTRFALNQFFPNLDQEKINIMYNPVDHLINYQINTTNMVQSNKPYILCVGGCKRHKNFNLVVEALDTLNDKYPGLGLIIIGERFDKQDYIDEAISRRRSKSLIIRLENVPDEELNGYYQKARLVIVPSLAEGFDYIPFESAYRGICPVISDIAVHRELYGASLPLFNPRDPRDLAEKIEQLIESPDKQADQMETIKSIGENYTIENFTVELISIYQKALAIN